MIALPKVLRLAERFGGCKLYVPKEVSGQQMLSRCIGAEAAQALAKAYGGDYIFIPRAAALQRLCRNLQIQQKRREGKTVRSLARVFDLTPRQVTRLSAGASKKSK